MASDTRELQDTTAGAASPVAQDVAAASAVGIGAPGVVRCVAPEWLT